MDFAKILTTAFFCRTPLGCLGRIMTYAITREIIKHHGRDCIEFTKIAVVVLNQIIRPFTAKWHRLSASKAFEDEKNNARIFVMNCHSFKKN